MTTPPIANRRPLPNPRLLGWGAAALLLLAPLIAMQFTNEVRWDATDFITIGTMLALVGLGIELAVRNLRTPRARLIAIGAVLLAFLWLWAELAVGLFTDWGS